MKKINFIVVYGSAFLFLLIASILILIPKKSNPKVAETDMGCAPVSYSGVVDIGDRIAYYNGQKLTVPSDVLATKLANADVLGVASEEKWIEVDLSEQILKAWEGDNLFMQTPISSGLQWTPTPTGEFRIWIKLRATKMEGGEGSSYYYLPNVPYVMFFQNENVPGWKGYSLHGTYWHSDFGHPHSHGCVNLPTDKAAIIYDWVSPVVDSGKWNAKATDSNPGTRIVIHE